MSSKSFPVEILEKEILNNLYHPLDMLNKIQEKIMKEDKDIVAGQMTQWIKVLLDNQVQSLGQVVHIFYIPWVSRNYIFKDESTKKN